MIIIKNTNEIHALFTQKDLDLKINSIYHLLPKLNDIEEMFITRVHIMMKVF